MNATRLIKVVTGDTWQVIDFFVAKGIHTMQKNMTRLL